MTTEDLPRKGGRPPGSTTKPQSTQELLDKYAQDTIKMLAEMRDFAQEQFREVRQHTKVKLIEPNDRLALVGTMSTLMKEVSEALQKATQCYKVIAESNTDDDSPVKGEDPHKVLKGILNGNT